MMLRACQRINTQDSDSLRIGLAHSLGFIEYPENREAEPYLVYIENHRFGRSQPEEYIRLFVRVIEYFKIIDSSNANHATNSIATLLDKLAGSSDSYFLESKAGSQERREDVEDTVLYIIGAWTMMLSSFVVVPVAGGIRKITMAYNLRMQDKLDAHQPYEEDVSGLVKGSALLPEPNPGQLQGSGHHEDIARTALKLVKLLSNDDGSSGNSASSLNNLMLSSGSTFTPTQSSTNRFPLDFFDDIESLESLSISATRLNALTLKVLGTVDIEWTYNLSRHMILSKRGGRHYLQVFALPCAFKATSIAQGATGIPSDLLHEIRESYSILFNAWPVKSIHARFGLRFCCWCWSCSAYRYRKKAIIDCKRASALESRRSRNNGDSNRTAFDPLLPKLMEYDASPDWTYDDFPHLWSRITSLELHLQTSRPWSIWVLFRDRRDTLQFWTFLSQSELQIALDEFQQTLSPAQKAQLTSFSSHVPTADDVVKLTDQAVENSKSRDSRLLASRLKGLLSPVQQYCNIIDTCVGPNQIAALVWGGIKFFLLSASNFAEYFDKLSEKIAQLSNCCPRLDEYEKLFPQYVRVQQAISDFYAVIIRFCCKAFGGLQEKGTRRFSKSIWKSFKIEFGELEESINAAKDEVDEEIRLASAQEARGFHRLLTTEAAKNEIFRAALTKEAHENNAFRMQQSSVSKRSEDRENLRSCKDEERQLIRLISRVPNYDYTLSLYRARALRCEGTCTWFLNTTEYTDWIVEGGPKSLWCYGIPGCGKTVLLGFLIDHLKKTLSSLDDTVVIYYFFDSAHRKSLDAFTFLRCILYQAISLKCISTKSRTLLESLFPDRLYSEPAAKGLEQLFLDLFENDKRLFLLIDGLDEANETEQRNVKSFLKRVQGLSNLKIFATSHVAIDMSKVFIQPLVFQIMSDHVKSDIATYIQSQIDIYSEEELSVCSPSDLELVKRILVNDSEGMFLWAGLQFKCIIDICEENGTPDEIPDLLESLPRDLTELYSSLLNRLARKGDDQIDRAQKAFQWVIYSKRPLKIEELEEAISIRTGQKAWKRPSFNLDASRLGKLCGNLIAYDQVNQIVVLAHHSIEMFLREKFSQPEITRFAIEEAEAEGVLMRLCLTYLSFTDFHQALIPTSDTTLFKTMDHPDRLIEHMAPGFVKRLTTSVANGLRSKRRDQPLDLVKVLRTELSARQSKGDSKVFRMLDYCKINWYVHARSIDPSDMTLLELLENFVRRTYLPKEWIPWSHITAIKSFPYWSMLIWMIQGGDLALFMVWKKIVGGLDLLYWETFWEEEGREMFVSACATSHIQRLKTIVEVKQLEREWRPSQYEINNEFLKACRQGDCTVAGLLLEVGADVNTSSSEEKQSALETAVEMGQHQMVEWLLQAGADANALPSQIIGRTVLQAAVERGDQQIVEQLLQAGAYANGRRSIIDGRTALQAAVERGDQQIVEQLLQAGADANANAPRSGLDRRTALQAAVNRGDEKIVKQLLQAGADANARPSVTGRETVLQIAARRGYQQMFEQLLQVGADVNAPPSSEMFGKTALQAAAGRGDLRMVEELLQAGADVNAKAGPKLGVTALQAAIDGGYFDIVKVLLEAGAVR